MKNVSLSDKQWSILELAARKFKMTGFTLSNSVAVFMGAITDENKAKLIKAIQEGQKQTEEEISQDKIPVNSRNGFAKSANQLLEKIEKHLECEINFHIGKKTEKKRFK